MCKGVKIKTCFFLKKKQKQTHKKLYYCYVLYQLRCIDLISRFKGMSHFKKNDDEKKNSKIYLFVIFICVVF